MPGLRTDDEAYRAYSTVYGLISNGSDGLFAAVSTAGRGDRPATSLSAFALMLDVWRSALEPSEGDSGAFSVLIAACRKALAMWLSTVRDELVWLVAEGQALVAEILPAVGSPAEGRFRPRVGEYCVRLKAIGRLLPSYPLLMPA